MIYSEATRLKKGHAVFDTMTGERKTVKGIEIRDETKNNPKTVIIRTTDGSTYTHRSLMPYLTQSIRERRNAREEGGQE